MFSTDVKTIAIVALGDLCLVTEQAFLQLLPRAMESLQGAAMLASQPTDIKVLGIDGAKGIHLLRKALVEAFMSMINGIKSPCDENVNNQNL